MNGKKARKLRKAAKITTAIKFSADEKVEKKIYKLLKTKD